MTRPLFDVVVLRHWREKGRATNSGKLVTECIKGARVVDMVAESYKNLAAHLPKGNVWLLFPESVDATGDVVVPSHRGLPHPLPKTVVVVDGTWAEAQRMAKALPGLPRLVPRGGPRATERLLAPPQAGAMATAEAVAALIEEVDPYAAHCLDVAYSLHVEAQKTGNRVRSNPYRAAIPIVSGIAYIENPTDLAGRYIPDRYLAGLPPALQKQRVRELTESRDAYKRGDFSELPTDVTARKMGLVKQSQYTTEAKKRGIEYRGDLRDMAKRVMAFYGHRATSGEVQQFADALRKSFSKGLAAWKSGGHRPGATAHNWAVARVNSLVVGGKTSWTADKGLFEVLPAVVRSKIEAMRMLR